MGKLTKKQKRWIKIGIVSAAVIGIGVYAYHKLPKFKNVGSIVPSDDGTVKDIPTDTVIGLRIMENVTNTGKIKEKCAGIVDVAEEIKCDWGVPSKASGCIFGSLKEIKEKSGIDLEKAKFDNDGLFYIPGELDAEKIKNDLSEGIVVEQKLGIISAFMKGAKSLVGNIPLKVVEKVVEDTAKKV